MHTKNDVQSWRGLKAADNDGEKIGTIEEIYLDRASGEPEWAAVKIGMFGSNLSFVPLDGAKPGDGEVRLGYSKSQVEEAPNIDADGELSPEEEQRLYIHYGRDDYDQWTAEDRAEDLGRGPVGHDTSGPTTDEAMTRSEEELRVGKKSREAGRARLRKYVETEQVETTVPVQREEVSIEREPITDVNVDDALQGPAISEEEHEIVLHEEQPVVEKRAVPKERVRLDKDTFTDEETVSDEVRKERIEAEGDVPGERR